MLGVEVAAPAPPSGVEVTASAAAAHRAEPALLVADSLPPPSPRPGAVHVDCVVGMRSAIRDDAVRTFAIGFYGGLGEPESIAAAYRQGCAAISLEGLPMPIGRSSRSATAWMPSSSPLPASKHGDGWAIVLDLVLATPCRLRITRPGTFASTRNARTSTPARGRI